MNKKPGNPTHPLYLVAEGVLKIVRVREDQFIFAYDQIIAIRRRLA